MENNYERPLDLLNKSKGKKVLVTLKNNKVISGTLTAFDIHINLTLDNACEINEDEKIKNFGLLFLRGDTIISISPA